MSAPTRNDALGPLSPTVRSALDAGSAEVTAIEFARDVVRHHGEYGGGLASRLRLDGVATTARRTPAAWLRDTRALFDATAAPVLHGRLVLVGLARLDHGLRTALDAGGFYDSVVREIREPLDTLWASASRGAEDRRWQELSPSSRAAFTYAAALAGADAVHTEHLVLGLYARPDGPPHRFLDHLGITRADLDAVLAKALGAPVPDLGEAPTPLWNLPRLTTHVRLALENARTAAGVPPVRTRHLLLGLVAVPDCGVAQALVDAKITADGFRQWLAEQAQRAGPLAGGINADRVDPNRGIPPEKDDLEVSTYVAMMAAAVARRDTELPLSIGLFGEWGSGKSYFMGLLREQVSELARRDDPAYCSGIVQIGFNAWSYADANLWASLGDEIFRALAGPDDVQDAEDAKRRDRIRKWLAEEQDRVKELESARAAAAEEVAKLRGELDRSEERRRSSATTLLEATLAAAGDAGAKELRGALDRLGLDDEAAQAQFLGDTVTKAGAAATALRRTAVRGRRRFLVAALVACLLVAVLGGVLSSGPLKAWLAGGGLLAALTAVGVFAEVARRMAGAVATVTRFAEEIRKRTLTGTDAKVQAAAQRVRAAQAQEQVLQAQLDQVVVRVGELGRELVELSPGQRLYTFLAERAASEDYRSQQGLIAMIRRDFERLARLQKQWREHPDDDSPSPIDRIVLYIDDLDRCTPHQIVEVLQAVHLLLALDLFVVVVGVDPRWLLHSLRDQYRSTLAGPGAGEDAERLLLGTPRDYLNKIFNIPFVLPAFTERGFETMLRRLTRPQSDGHASPPAELPAMEPPAGEVPEVVPPIEQGSELDAVLTGATVESTPLTEPELGMLSLLAPLVRSPREAKRLINLYRILRSTQDLGDASRFLSSPGARGGDFQAVALLLGLLTADPGRVGEILFTEPDPDRGVAGGLCHRTEPQGWPAFLDGLRPREEAGRWANDLDPDLTEAGREQWERLVGRVAPASAHVTLPDLHRFVTWAPRVARFSFLLAPLGDDTPSPRE